MTARCFRLLKLPMGRQTPWAILAGLLLGSRAALAAISPGLALEVEGGQRVGRLVSERPALSVLAGESPAPGIPPGAFRAAWSGWISAELRSDFLFRLEFSGKARLHINGVPILQGEGVEQGMISSKPVRLNKGTNHFQLSLESTSGSGASLRVLWGEKEFLLQPIPASALSHDSSPAELSQAEVLRGRELFADLRCARCHGDATFAGGMPELLMEGPTLDGIGSRRRVDWMRRWILDPNALRAGAEMPRVFSGPDAAEQARAVAAYLATLEDSSEPKPGPGPEPVVATASIGSALPPLFERLHCAGCHTLDAAPAEGSGLISLAEVGGKFKPGRLEEFLRKPEAHYRWIRMPNFRLSSEEARALAALLLKAPPEPDLTEPRDPKLVAKGRELVRTSGCLNCHSLRLDNLFSGPSLAGLAGREWRRGCLATQASERGRAPHYALPEGQRRSLQALGRTDLATLRQDTGADFAARQSQRLRCQSCHGPMTGIPAFDILGAKLTPEWAAAFLAGEVLYKPRGERHPRGELWLPARMPAFPAYARGIARGLASSHGLPAHTAAEGPIDLGAAEVGRKLVGKEGGFSCVSCHAVGHNPALEVFESEGINLAHSARRLQRSFFERWMRSPIAIDPQTKMPAYFDEDGQSQLAEVLDGKAVEQIRAIWEYLRMGENMVPPGASAPAP